MKYPTMRFVFDRKKVATKTHKGLVQIEVLSEGKRKWIGTGVKVYSDQWNDRKKIINSVEMIQLNQCLDEQLRIIQNWINELISKKEVFDFDKLDRFLRYTNKSESFVDFVERRIEERGDITESTKASHRTFATSLREFDRIIYLKDARIDSETICRGRDLFIFQAYTGISYADLAKFNFKRDVQKRGNKYVILDIRLKTEENYFIVLLSPAMEILKKYDYVLPIISNQQYNLRLKIVADYAGLDRNLTVHLARHTYATLQLSNGTDIFTVSKMLGHTNVRTTQRYTKVVDEKKENAADAIKIDLAAIK